MAIINRKLKCKNAISQLPDKVATQFQRLPHARFRSLKTRWNTSEECTMYRLAGNKNWSLKTGSESEETLYWIFQTR